MIYDRYLELQSKWDKVFGIILQVMVADLERGQMCKKLLLVRKSNNMTGYILYISQNIDWQFDI